MKKFIDPKDHNAEQYKAIVAPSSIDILISAGAGSGKTKTLSKRVNHLIVEGEVDPSALLVLTFTDNAAHEMEERIVNSFAEDQDAEIRALGVKMLSSHIQTFDSFSQYLVSKYANRLGIASSISILDGTIESTKINQFLDEIFKEHYENPAEHDSFVAMLTKYNTASDENTKNIVLDLYEKMQKLMPRAKQEFYERYDELYLGKEKFASMRSEYISGLKKKVIGVLLRLAYRWNYENKLTSIQEINEFFAKPTFFQSPFWISTNYEFLDKPYQEVYSLLSLDDDSFIAKVKEYHAKGFKKCFPFPSKKELGNIEDDRDLKGFHTALCHIFDTNEATLIDACKLLGSVDDDYKAYLESKDDVHLLLRMEKELEDRLLSYKQETNCFTFSDVSSMSLRLLTEPEFEDIAEEVRSRFSYIMVDEYQDTNDFQEAVIDSLLKPNKEGKRAHLFCVGDPKQAIYAFRNSNVKLFLNRQERLKSNPPSEVIHMNKNYRSGPHFLDEVNYFFKFCMRKDQGDVDYLDPGEQLAHDGKTYKKDYPHFGIYRIVSTSGCDDNQKEMDYEIHAIVDDIKNKIARGFPVYDRDGDNIRPCRYSDFAILCRTKKSFAAFQKAFQENDMPLNVKVDTNLLDVNAILAFESLVGMLCAIVKNDDHDLPHLFASLARSYLFSYEDSKVFSALANLKNKDDPYKLIKNDPIYLSILLFKKRHEDKPFREIFLDLLDEFGVIRKLYRIGNVGDNIEKLDSLFALALTQEKMGEGIDDFVELFSSIKRYALPFDAETSVSAENSVDLMTIHASKGLERRVVYMPVSQCQFTKGFLGETPDYDYDTDLGILLPRYTLSSWLKKEGEEPLKQSVYSLPRLLYKARCKTSDPDFDEHVRLIYVALTRAQNSCYLVGDREKKAGGKKSLYYLLDQLPHRKVFEPNLLKRCLNEGVFGGEYAKYLGAVELQKKASFISKEDFARGISEELLEERYPIYQQMRQEFLLKGIEKQIEDSLGEMTDALYERYVGIAKRSLEVEDFDFLAKIYGRANPDLGEVTGYGSYLSAQENLYNVDADLAKERLVNFFNDATGDNSRDYKDQLLPCYAYVIGGYPYVLRDSYENGEQFRDIVSFYSYKNFATKGAKAPAVKKVDEKQLSDDEILFAPVHKKRASKKTIIDPDDPVREILDYGSRLHRYMELVDLKTKDTSFIKNERERRLIDEVLSTSLLNDLDGFEIYQEYGYYDEEFLTTGSIDLLLVGKEEVRIIDYKTKHIDDPAYLDQLRVYRRNVCSLFGVSLSKVKAYLLPLTGEEAKQMDLD